MSSVSNSANCTATPTSSARRTPTTASPSTRRAPTSPSCSAAPRAPAEPPPPPPPPPPGGAPPLPKLPGEPWWELFYGDWIVTAMLFFKRDFRTVLDIAVKNTLELRKPLFDNFPQRYSV